jgi:hypothetical protein
MPPVEAMPPFAFLLAFDPGYCRMATALVNSLIHFHPGRLIRVYTLPEHVEPLRVWARPYRDIEVVAYRPPHQLAFGEWHPLIWAKLEAFAAEEHTFQVVLDVDQLLYRSLSRCIAEAAGAGKLVAASPDISDLRAHVLPSFRDNCSDNGRDDGHDDPDDQGLDALAGVPCFNAGAMIIRPSQAAYRDIIALARRHHTDLRLPEQAIFNLWARQAGGHHDLGERFMLQPWSPRVLEPRVPSCLIHFWTPRPPFFGTSPLRSGEPTWETCLQAFEHDTGRPYPLARFERDFMVRLEGALPARRLP